MVPRRRTTSVPALRSRIFWLRVRNYNGRRQLWCTASMPTARSAWSKNFATPADMPSTSPFISSRIESGITGQGKAQSAKGKEQSEVSLFTLRLALCSLPSYWWPGTESNRRRRPFQWWHGRPARESRARCACHGQTASPPSLLITLIAWLAVKPLTPYRRR